MDSRLRKTKFSNPEPQIHKTLASWAASCAEHTLCIFEEEYPDDKRPRLAIETLRSWTDGRASMVDCRKAAFAAHAAAREAKSLASIAAARSAGQAAAVAHMWNHAPHAANYAAKAVELRSDEDEPAQARDTERDWQWNQLDEDIRALGFPKGR